MWDNNNSTISVSIDNMIQSNSSTDPVLYTPLNFNSENHHHRFDKKTNLLSQSAPRPSSLTKLFTAKSYPSSNPTSAVSPTSSSNYFNHVSPLSAVSTTNTLGTTTTTSTISRSSSCTRTAFTLLSSNSSMVALTDDTLLTQNQPTKAPIDPTPDSPWSVDYKSLHGLTLYPECRGLKFTDCPKPDRICKADNLVSRQVHTPPPSKGGFCIDDIDDDDEEDEDRDDDDDEEYDDDSDSDSDSDDAPITLHTSTHLHIEPEDQIPLQFDNNDDL